MTSKKQSTHFLFLVIVAFLWVALIMFVGLPSSQLSNTLETELSKLVKNADVGVTNPVLEKPDFDRLRFVEAMKRDALADRQRREQEKRDRQIQEDLKVSDSISAYLNL